MLLRICVCLFAVSSCASFAQSPEPRYVPMNQAERTRTYLKNLVNPLSVLAAATGAGFSQAQNTPSEWKQGGSAYGLRLANSYGYHFVRQTIMFGASSVLHEDNRYIPSGLSGKGARLKYAIESNFLARHDDGTRHFSYSRLGATLGTAFLSRAWQPTSTSRPQNAASSFGITLAVQVGFHVAHEFVPFLRGRP